MKETAVVICNWNKKDYVLNCIESVLASTYRDFDLIVVDNASTDGSAEAVKERFGSHVHVIENERNLGGAGGFNTGIRYALERKYTYIHLLDNDVRIDAMALEKLRTELVGNPDIGIAGSLIYDMDHPDTIQEMGSMIDWNVYHMKLNFKGHQDRGDIPESVECDYVPACSMMIRSSILQRIGGMDERYFIYWDDIDLCHRVKREGYRVVAFADSKVWHKRGVAVRTDTFANYYVWRNRLHFFAKYCETERMDHFVGAIFEEWFRSLFFSDYKGQHSSARSILLAVEDALHHIRGKASDNRIFQKESSEDPIRTYICNAKSAAIIDSPKLELVRTVIERIKSYRPDLSVQLVGKFHDAESLKRQFEDVEIVEARGWKPDAAQIVCQTCEHIVEERSRLEADVMYIDPYMNIVSSKADRIKLQSYDTVYELYKNIHYPVMRTKLLELHQALSSERNG
ncbi:glycosyltransferase family 2 protein [Cohnella caldifontis]|uniref:glycosyltransferase family 2 protein n=1 Tax=Cohnella caldifontis TaxID=3027471 RepID=UPI0023ED2499|nr:glycosyltransferase family 2 protein [Cohnella sp. YIM B05605]